MLFYHYFYQTLTSPTILYQLLSNSCSRWAEHIIPHHTNDVPCTQQRFFCHQLFTWFLKKHFEYSLALYFGLACLEITKDPFWYTFEALQKFVDIKFPTCFASCKTIVNIPPILVYISNSPPYSTSQTLLPTCFNLNHEFQNLPIMTI